MTRLRFAALLLLATSLHAQPIPPTVQNAFDALRPDAIRAHTRFLSSDLLEGRGPGTRGDELARAYIAARLEAMGLQPAGDNGTFMQKVSLLGVEPIEEKSSLAFTKGGKTVLGPMKLRDEYAGGNQSQVESTTLDSEVIFVGHGVVAPEYKWDDYKGIDTKGKTLIMLVDDPPASEKEPDLFKGRARTYYGRWTYKYEIGTAKGAQAVLLIHTTDAAGYGWQVVRNSWSGETSYMRNAPGAPALRFAGWITEDVAKKLFAAAGQDLAALTKAAASRDFKPVSLGFRLTGSVGSKLRPFDTANVVAKLEGSDPSLKNEAILYSAHHDHLGIGAPDDNDKSDRIYNGAIDNATGSATILELARVWSVESPRAKRSVLFAWVAAEEQGLLGSQYLAQHPPIPAGKISLAINLDALDLFGKVKSVTMIGVEKMTFFPAAQAITKLMNLTIVPDQQPEQGSYYRSDHFSLAKAGVPAFSIKQGQEVIGHPDAWGAAKWKEYREKHYHQPSDEFDPTWDFESAVQIAQLAFWFGWEAGNAADLVNWNAGEEFAAVRAASQK